MPKTRERVMVVLIDDNPEDLFLVERAIGKTDLPLEVLPFESGEAAQEFFAHVDRATLPLPREIVILCDIKMPGVSGFDFVGWLKSKSRFGGARVYMVSGSNDPQDRAQAAELKVDGYCLKFPEPSVLRRIILNERPIAVCEV
jgi:CheY-like chemotaxis protein